jgi:hypothetical protein
MFMAPYRFAIFCDRLTLADKGEASRKYFRLQLRDQCFEECKSEDCRVASSNSMDSRARRTTQVEVIRITILSTQR